MPYDPSGNFTRDYDWTQDRNNGVKVRADRMDGEFNNFATAMNQVILRNGVAAFSGNVQLGGNSIVALADGTVGTPAIRFLGSPTTGVYSPGLDKVALTASGNKRVEATTVGVDLFGATTITGATSITGNTSVTGTLTASAGFALGGVLNFPTSPGIIQVNGTGVLNMSSAGNVGIGIAATPASRVYARVGTTDTAYYADNSSNSGFAVKFGSSLTTIGNDFGAPLAFMTGNVERARIDAAGAATFGSTLGVAGKTNTAGLYVSNNAWLLAGAVFGLSGDNDNRTWITSNGTNFDLRVNNANRFNINSAGDASFTGSGGFGGTVSATGTFRADAAGTAFLRNYIASVEQSRLTTDATETSLLTIGATPLVFGTNSTGRMTVAANGNVAASGAQFTVAGNLGVGTTSPVSGAGFGHVTADGTSGSFYNARVNGTIYGVFGALSSEMRLLTPNSTPIYMYTNNTLRMAVTDTQTYFSNAQSPSSPLALGYLGVPSAGIKTSNYTTVLSDAGQYVTNNNNGGTLQIAANASVPYPVGTTITFVNIHANPCNVAIVTDTLRLAGTGTTGTRTLAQYGMATALKIAATEWLINGPGLT